MINPLPGALSSSLSGLQNASKRLDTAANNIVHASDEGSNVNIESELLNTLSAKQDYQANAAVLKRTAELGKILNEVV